jgi:hypothetical protein
LGYRTQLTVTDRDDGLDGDLAVVVDYLVHQQAE